MSNPDIPTSDETAPFDDPGHPSQRDQWDLGASELDDEGDWKELRDRYYGLLQELRVILPGAQVLVAFLLTAPFAAGFPHLDSTNRFLFGVATVSGLLSVITLLTPTVFHRVANRRYRSARLVWAVRCTMVGLVLLGIALDRRGLLRDPPHLLDAARRRRERLRAAHDHLAVGHPPEDREAEPHPRT